MKSIKSSMLAFAALLHPALVHSKMSVTANSWGGNRIDLFGVDSKRDVWHKYYTGYGWEPNNGPGLLEIFAGAYAESPISLTSWSSDRLNFVFMDVEGKTRHKYWTGSGWGPEGPNFEDLGEGPTGKVQINSWGKDRLDLVGRSEDGTCLHKAWTGEGWFPEVDEWEDLGGDLAGDPVIVSWGPGKLDIFGVTNEGNVSHKYWTGSTWVPEGKEWEDLGGKGFSGSLTASVAFAMRLDLWAVGKEDGELYHLFYEPLSSQWYGWENLGGGKFTNAPQVVHWGPNRIDILGLESSKDAQYMYKYWDGSQWSEWEKKVGSFESEPAMVWDGSQWLPSSTTWYELGDAKIDNYGELLKAQKSNSRFFGKANQDDFELKL